MAEATRGRPRSEKARRAILTAAREVHVPRTSKASCARAILDEVETVLTAQ